MKNMKDNYRQSLKISFIILLRLHNKGIQFLKNFLNYWLLCQGKNTTKCQTSRKYLYSNLITLLVHWSHPKYEVKNIHSFIRNSPIYRDPVYYQSLLNLNLESRRLMVSHVKRRRSVTEIDRGHIMINYFNITQFNKELWSVDRLCGFRLSILVQDLRNLLMFWYIQLNKIHRDTPSVNHSYSLLP